MQKISWKKWCISCGKQNESHLNVDLYSDDVESPASSVLKYLQIVVPGETKLYAGKICIACYSTISFIVQFNNHVVKVQKMFLELEKHGYDESICIESLQKKFELISQPVIKSEFQKNNEFSFPTKYIAARDYDTDDEIPEENKLVYEGENPKSMIDGKTTAPNAVFLIENNSVLDNAATEVKTKDEILCGMSNTGKNNSFDRDSTKNICPKCQKVFKLKRYMDNHLRRVHKKDKSFKCNICNENFDTKKCLGAHSLSHKDERKHKCPECDKAFKQKQDLKVHSAIHDGIGCICQICGVKCKTKNVLRSHMIVHSDTKKYKCNFCSKEFKRSKEFKYHLILHTGLKPYQCPFCDLKFPNRPNCRKHQKTAHPKELAEEELKGHPKFFKAIPSINELNELVLKKDW